MIKKKNEAILNRSKTPPVDCFNLKSASSLNDRHLFKVHEVNIYIAVISVRYLIIDHCVYVYVLFALF